MHNEFQEVIEWLRTQDHRAAFALLVENGVPDGTAHDLLAAAPRPAFLPTLEPLGLVPQTAVIRAVVAIGWRQKVWELGPLQAVRVRTTVNERDLRQPEAFDYLAAKLAIKLATDLLDKGYLRLEGYRSDANAGELNLQLVFREEPEPSRGSFFDSIKWPKRVNG